MIFMAGIIYKYDFRSFFFFYLSCIPKMVKGNKNEKCNKSMFSGECTFTTKRQLTPNVQIPIYIFYYLYCLQILVYMFYVVFVFIWISILLLFFAAAEIFFKFSPFCFGCCYYFYLMPEFVVCIGYYYYCFEFSF